jgi:hypothetical protein
MLDLTRVTHNELIGYLDDVFEDLDDKASLFLVVHFHILIHATSELFDQIQIIQQFIDHVLPSQLVVPVHRVSIPNSYKQYHLLLLFLLFDVLSCKGPRRGWNNSSLVLFENNTAIYVPRLPSMSGVIIGLVGLEIAETDTVRINSPLARGETTTAVDFFGEARVRPEVGVCGV